MASPTDLQSFCQVLPPVTSPNTPWLSPYPLVGSSIILSSCLFEHINCQFQIRSFEFFKKPTCTLVSATRCKVRPAKRKVTCAVVIAWESQLFSLLLLWRNTHTTQQCNTQRPPMFIWQVYVLPPGRVGSLLLIKTRPPLPLPLSPQPSSLPSYGNMLIWNYIRNKKNHSSPSRHRRTSKLATFSMLKIRLCIRILTKIILSPKTRSFEQ